MKTITGLKLSEVVKLFEDGKALGCKPTGQNLYLHLRNWNMLDDNISTTWDVQLKPQDQPEKREITLEQLEQAWDMSCTKYYNKAATSKVFANLAEELGFNV